MGQEVLHRQNNPFLPTAGGSSPLVHLVMTTHAVIRGPPADCPSWGCVCVCVVLGGCVQHWWAKLGLLWMNSLCEGLERSEPCSHSCIPAQLLDSTKDV